MSTSDVEAIKQFTEGVGTVCVKRLLGSLVLVVLIPFLPVAAALFDLIAARVESIPSTAWNCITCKSL